MKAGRKSLTDPSQVVGHMTDYFVIYVEKNARSKNEGTLTDCAVIERNVRNLPQLLFIGREIRARREKGSQTCCSRFESQE
jgi:hypothetical protein